MKVSFVQDLICDLPACVPGNAALPKAINKIAVVGMSCAGKTSMINATRIAPELLSFVHIPQRSITRPQRWGDDLVENKHVTHAEFASDLAIGLIDVAWQRDLGEAIESYGFAPVSLENKEKLHIYSANVALITPQNQLNPENFLEDCLVVAVVTDQITRKNRLIARSPDLLNKTLELQKRLTDETPIIEAGAHILLDNSHDITKSKQQFVQLISNIVKYKQALA